MIQEDNTKAIMGHFRIFKVPSELETNFNNRNWPLMFKPFNLTFFVY